MRTVEVIEVVERGSFDWPDGSSSMNGIRTRYYSRDGELLAEHGPHQAER